MKKATFGLDENIASLLSYAGMFVTGLVFLIAEKENKKVRFNALQSTVWFGLLAVVQTVLKLVIGWIPLIGSLVMSAVGVVVFASLLYLVYNAYKGIEFRIPIIGDVVQQTIYK